MSQEKKQSAEKKNFLALLKSNPQTLDEAKQKTKADCILAAIIFGVFTVLFCFFSIIIGVLWAVASVGIILYLYFKWNQKNKRNFCSDCGARFDYEECVSWEVSDVERKTKSKNPNVKSKQVIAKDVATVIFTCTCKECGNEKSFSEKYDITTWYDDGSCKDVNLQNVARNYFKL